MANTNASIQTGFTGTQVPTNKPDVTEYSGRIRYMMSTITVTTTIIGDTITWGSLPVGARLLGNLSKLYFAAGTASTTLNLGDSASAARYLAATSVAAAGSAVPEAANASGATYKITAATASLISTCAGATLLIGQVITLHAAYVID